MNTKCTPEVIEFHGLGRRQVIGEFNGGNLSSDGGVVLLRELEKRLPVMKRLAACFTDFRDPERIEHDVIALLRQRIYAIALGYEDLNDHDALRHDPLLAVACDKADPEGQDRHREQDRGKALAGKSTLNRLELGDPAKAQADRYKRIIADSGLIDALMVDLFVESHDRPPAQIILDVDATDDPVHGNQEGRFFHGYYKAYCYLPLYIFCGQQLLCARLRRADQDGAAGTVEELERIVGRIRQSWPKVRIILRGDSGFCRDQIMRWCEQNGVDYVLGLARNSRLEQILATEQEKARRLYRQSGRAVRVFKDFDYRTRDSWSATRRVIGKAEHLAMGANPRFIVTSLRRDQIRGRLLYERIYCARGNMENRIKEQQLDLFADRTSSHGMAANQLRLYFSSFAYILLQSLRRVGLRGTPLEKAQCGTIRLKLFKFAAQIRLSVRKVWLSFSQNYPWRGLFEQVLDNLRRIPIPLRC